MSDIIKTPRSLAKKALHQPTHRFDPLYCQREGIETALEGVLANQGARTPGLDGITKEDLVTEGSCSALVQALEQELREGSYHPLPIRRVYIPKSNGKHRPLGISTLKDRVVQMLIKMVLEPGRAIFSTTPMVFDQGAGRWTVLPCSIVTSMSTISTFG